MKSVTELVDDLGGPTAVASLLDLPETTVSSWKIRNRLPVRYWPQFISLAADKKLKGVNYHALVRLHSERAA